MEEIKIKEINICNLIGIKKIHIFKLKLYSKQKRLKIINEINNIGCLSTGNKDYKYKNIAYRLKKKLYPDSMCMAGYYCPKLYWIVIILLKNKYNLISNYFKARAYENLPREI